MKFLGAVALLAPLPTALKEWAYADIMADDNMYQGAVVGIVPWLLSYWQFRKRV